MSAETWLRRILVPFLLTRAALLAVGFLALGLLGSARPSMPGNLVAHESVAAPLEIWARWDSEWYLLIARHGYQVGDQLRNYSVRYHDEDAAGFFPLYPALLGALDHLGLPAVLAGILLSNAALLLALTLLYLLSLAEWDESAAANSVWMLLGFPFSLFLSAVYAESLALALILASFYLARHQRWGALAACGFLCALTRPTALLAAPALAWEVRERRGGWRGAAALLGFPAGLAAFSGYCAVEFGNPLIWAERQQRWRGDVSGPWQAFLRFCESKPQLHGAHNSILELITAVLLLSALVPVLRRTPRSWGTFALLSLLVPLSSTLWSFGRLSLVAFPIFAWLGAWARRDAFRLPAYLGVTLPLGGFLMALFACGWWAG